jgi:hypothetical protein
MKLSDAMEQGWQLVPRSRGDYQLRDDEGELHMACALGAACYIADPARHIDCWEDVAALFPQIEEPVDYMTEHGLADSALGVYIVHLNDGTLLEPSEIVEKVRNLGY